MGKGEIKQRDWTTKLNSLLDLLGMRESVTVMASMGKNLYRKPSLGMWHFLAEKLSGTSVMRRDR